MAEMKMNTNKQWMFEAVGEIKGIRVLKSQGLLQANGVLGAAATYVQLVGDNAPKPAIILADDFMEYEKPLRQFMLLHEIGHIVNGHPELMCQIFKSQLGYVVSRWFSLKKSLNLEFAADEFAAKNLGKEKTTYALSRLSEDGKIGNAIDRFVNRRECRKRIANILSKF